MHQSIHQALFSKRLVSAYRIHSAFLLGQFPKSVKYPAVFITTLRRGGLTEGLRTDTDKHAAHHNYSVMPELHARAAVLRCMKKLSPRKASSTVSIPGRNKGNKAGRKGND